MSREDDGFMKVWVNNKLITNSENIKNLTPYTKRGVGLDFGYIKLLSVVGKKTVINHIQI